MKENNFVQVNTTLSESEYQRTSIREWVLESAYQREHDQRVSIREEVSDLIVFLVAKQL